MGPTRCTEQAARPDRLTPDGERNLVTHQVWDHTHYFQEPQQTLLGARGDVLSDGVTPSPSSTAAGSPSVSPERGAPEISASGAEPSSLGSVASAVSDPCSALCAARVSGAQASFWSGLEVSMVLDLKGGPGLLRGDPQLWSLSNNILRCWKVSAPLSRAQWRTSGKAQVTGMPGGVMKVTPPP